MGRFRLIRYKPLEGIWANLLAEYIGTFFFIITVAMSIQMPEIGNRAALAQGFALSAVVFSFGYISSAVFNPSIAIALWVLDLLETKKCILYIITELLAGFSAALMSWFLAGNGAAFAAPAPITDSGNDIGRAMMAEFIFTFGLMSTVLHVACSRQRDNQHYGMAIGLFLVAAVFATGGVSGGAVNPSIATSLQLVKCMANGCRELGYVWIYWLCPVAGAVFASMVFALMHPIELAVEEDVEDVICCVDEDGNIECRSAAGEEDEEEDEDAKSMEMSEDGIYQKPRSRSNSTAVVCDTNGCRRRKIKRISSGRIVTEHEDGSECSSQLNASHNSIAKPVKTNSRLMKKSRSGTDLSRVIHKPGDVSTSPIVLTHHRRMSMGIVPPGQDVGHWGATSSTAYVVATHARSPSRISNAAHRSGAHHSRGNSYSHNHTPGMKHTAVNMNRAASTSDFNYTGFALDSPANNNRNGNFNHTNSSVASRHNRSGSAHSGASVLHHTDSSAPPSPSAVFGKTLLMPDEGAVNNLLTMSTTNEPADHPTTAASASAATNKNPSAPNHTNNSTTAAVGRGAPVTRVATSPDDEDEEDDHRRNNRINAPRSLRTPLMMADTPPAPYDNIPSGFGLDRYPLGDSPPPPFGRRGTQNDAQLNNNAPADNSECQT